MRLFAFVLLLCLTAFPARAEEAAVPVTKTEATPARETPLRADAGLTKAEGQLAEGKYTQALETLGGVLARRPGDADAQTYAGYAWQRLGDMRKAAEYYDRAIKYDPQHLGANTYRAELYLQAGEFQRAMEQLQALRVICAGLPCAEMDRLQAKLNTSRVSKKEEPRGTEKTGSDAPANEDR